MLNFVEYIGRDVDFEIRIGNSLSFLDNPVCYKYDGVVPLSSKHDCLTPTCGRYVSIQRTNDDFNYMQVCEMMAFTGEII